MGKLKNPIFLLITVLVLAACSALPRIVAAVQDSTAVNSIHYSSMQSVALELSEEQASLTIFEKLSLIGKGYFYDLAEDKAAMTQTDVTEAVKTNLGPYYYLDLVPYNWSDYEMKAAPYFVYGTENSETYCIIWVVSISWGSNKEDYSSLDLYVDDDTGKILYVHYHSAASLSMYTLDAYVTAFCDAYFDSLGMDDLLDNPNAYDVTLLYEDLGQNSADPGARYTMYHHQYGQLVFEFIVYEQGFYMTIS